VEKEQILSRIAEVGLVAVVRAESSEQAQRIADACVKGGAAAVEITFTVPGADKVIRDLAQVYKNGELLLGAGTVMDAETARTAILAGAQYVVSPYLNTDVVRLCNRYRVPCMPGAMSIKEVVESMEAGADIIKIFPVIGTRTGGKYHLKTAGTNWLEAIRTIGKYAPNLYREIHQYAAAHLKEAKKYYDIKGELKNVPDIYQLSDEELPHLMDQDDCRQVIHITYGLILQAKNADESFIFRDRIYHILDKYENEYADGLVRHIGKHLKYLGYDE
jgi:Entner-Doudoroff aldolase